MTEGHKPWRSWRHCAGAASGQVAVTISARGYDRKHAEDKLGMFDIKIQLPWAQGEGERAESKVTFEAAVELNTRRQTSGFSPATRRKGEWEREGRREKERVAPAVWQSCTPSKFDIPSGLQRELCSAAAMEFGKCTGSVLIGVYLWATIFCQGGSLIELQSVFCLPKEEDSRRKKMMHIDTFT